MLKISLFSVMTCKEDPNLNVMRQNVGGGSISKNLPEGKGQNLDHSVD